VELNVCPATSPLLAADPWRLRGSQLGRLVEAAVDAAYTLSWPGPLEIYVPVHDTGGYDRVRTPFGRFDHQFEQIKGTAGRSPRHADEVRISFDHGPLEPHRALRFTFVQYDLDGWTLLDPAWRVPSSRLLEACTRRRCAECRKTHYDFIANPSGLSRDRAHRFQVPIRELASRLWSRAPATALDQLSLLPVESGPFFERHFDASMLETAAGDEILLASDPDLFGRDRMLVSKRTLHWVSIAIKGSTQLVGTSHNMEAEVRQATFSPHPRHLVLVQHYDRQAEHIHDWSYLVPSDDFLKLATRSGGHLQFSTSLLAQRPNRWTPYRLPTATVPDAVRRHLRA
jgi:hypothetical protein